ncbi:hypothetical protein [Lysobacter capsici]|uniref:hypothetical protein n=1 Tax=Lysobacter capsici TaxID=435897 RepID=UPI000AEFA397|nr:hypothetical protein [Lysobacter capsici]
MLHSNPATSSVDLLLLLLRTIHEKPEAATYLAGLDPAALDLLHTKASSRHHRAIDEARNFLDIALESLDIPLSSEHQRRLIERADDELASAQRWGELAANARFCLQRPELAQQLAGDARAAGSDDAAGDGGKRSRGRERSAG